MNDDRHSRPLQQETPSMQGFFRRAAAFFRTLPNLFRTTLSSRRNPPPAHRPHTQKRRPGDIYIVEHQGQIVGAIQHVDTDGEQLGSHVVSAIANLPADWASLDDSDFGRLPRAFCAHVLLGAGETLSIWKKMGSKACPELSGVLWCAAPSESLQQAESVDWEVWRTSGRKRKPDSLRELESCEFGYVMPPSQIVARLLTGSYTFRVPKRKV